VLPVLAVRGDILDAIARSPRLVLSAPTGSGKSTQVPQILAGSSSVAGRILVLEPRRLAARLVARRVAQEMGTPVGGLVGYQTRFESQISRETRIQFITEGIFLRLLQGDPRLDGVGAVVLDEFHERSIDVDLALGLIKRLQETTRPDLRLVVMSATLDVDRVARYLGDCPRVSAEGRLHPVAITHLAATPTAPSWELAAAALDDVLAAGAEGDVLVFMPGGYEIDRTIELARGVVARRGGEHVVLPLHGSLPPDEQDRAVIPSRRPKVVVATNVAETSITIEGVRTVIDAGTARVHRVDPKRGLNTLRVEPIARATAEQRSGRAGRVAPGRCIRLWTERDHAKRPAFETPEIGRIDLADALLRLKALGIGRSDEFPWFESPAAEMVERAEACLRMLHATDGRGGLTELGIALASVPAEPRVARVLAEGARRGCVALAARLAAVASERDFVIDASPAALRDALDEGDPISDVFARARLLERFEEGRLRGLARRVEVHPLGIRECQRVAARYRRHGERLASGRSDGGSPAEGVACLLAGFGDRLAWRPDRERPHCHLEGRRNVVLDRSSIVVDAGFILALDVRETGGGDRTLATISMATPVERAIVEEVLPERFTSERVVRWNEASKAVDEIEEDRFDSIVIGTTARPARPGPAVEAILVERIREGSIALERWDEAVEQWIARVRCVRQWCPERSLIAYDDDEIDLVAGCVRASEIRDRPVIDAVRNALSFEDQQLVERMAPEYVRLKRGFRMRLRYEPGSPPRGRAKIQDLYGEESTPTVAGGRVPVILEITGPNQRPLQVTSDLANFWRVLYPEIRNELRRRYPKHEWR
jgi:ATP-dependent helicase HrpB